jgi:hypothetical protein
MKIIQQIPMTILPIFLAGEFLHKIEAVFLLGLIRSPIRLRLFFAGFEGVIMGLDYGKSKCFWFRLWDSH